MHQKNKTAVIGKSTEQNTRNISLRKFSDTELHFIIKAIGLLSTFVVKKTCYHDPKIHTQKYDRKKNRQDKLSTYNVTLRHICASNLSVENQ